MNPLLEVNPAACLFVVGPQLTARQSSENARALNYRSIVEAGIAALQCSQAYSSKEEMSRDVRAVKEEGKKNLVHAMQRIVHILKQHGTYEEWLQASFRQEETLDVESQSSSSTPESIAHLLSLQSQGALLACTEYDTLLDSMADAAPFTLQEVKKWAEMGERKRHSHRKRSAGETQGHKGNSGGGFLHLHGVYTSPESIRLVDTEEGIDTAPTCKELREIFQRKLVIFLGFDGEYMDPLLPAFLNNLFLDSESGSLRNPPILLTSWPSGLGANSGRRASMMTSATASRQIISSKFLQLRIQEKEVHSLSGVISAGSPKNFTVGKGHTDKQSDGMKVQAFLLFNEKQSFRKLGDIIYQQSKSGEIYVRRDALTVIFNNNQILYGNLVTYGGNGLRQLWELVFSEESTLLGKGLVGFGLQNSAIIWTRRKPAGLGNVTGINSVHTYAAHKALHTLTLAQQCGLSDSKSPILVPVSTPPPTTTPTHQHTSSSSLSPEEPNASTHIPSSPLMVPISSTTSPSKSSGGLVKIDSNSPSSRNSTPTTTFQTASPLTNFYPTTLPPQPASFVNVPAVLPTAVAVNPIHNPFMAGLTRLTTPAAAAGIFSPVILTNNPLFNTATSSTMVQLPSGTNITSIPTQIQPQAAAAMQVNNNSLSTHIQMIYQLQQSSRLNSLSAAQGGSTIQPAGPLSPPDGLVSHIAAVKASYIMRSRGTPAYCIAPPAESLSSVLDKNDSSTGASDSLYEHTIEYIDTLSSTSDVAGENGREEKESEIEISVHENPASLPHVGGGELLVTRSSERLKQAVLLSDNVRRISRMVSSEHDVQEEEVKLNHVPQTMVPEGKRVDFSKRQTESSRNFRKSSPPVTKENISTLKVPTSLPLTDSKLPPPLLSLSTTIQTAASPPSVNPLPAAHLATTASSLLQRHTTNTNNLSSFSPSTANTTTPLMAPANLVSLQPGLAGYCMMPFNPFTGLTAAAATAAGTPLQQQPTLLLPTTPLTQTQQSVTVPVGFQTGSAALNAAVSPPQGQLPVLISPQQLPPAAASANPSAAATTLGIGSQMVYCLMANNGSSGTLQLQKPTTTTGTTTSHTPAYMYVHPQQQQQQQQQQSIVTHPHSTTPNFQHTGSQRKRSPLKRGPGDGLSTSPPRSKHRKITNKGSDRHTSFNHTQPGNIQELHLSPDTESKSHDTQCKSQDTQVKSHDSTVASTKAESSDEVQTSGHYTSSEEEDKVGAVTERESREEGGGGATAVGHLTTGPPSLIPLQLATPALTTKGHIQLWEFLLQLLLTPDHGAIIQWTGNSYEFSIINPDAVARLWGSCKNKPRMTYEKLSRALRYYYSRGILDKVPDKRLTFRFSFDVHKYIVERNKASNHELNSSIT